MKIIVVANQKGGSGKSTLVAHLSVAAAEVEDGLVVITDTDPQGTSADWFNARDAENVAYMPSTMSDFPGKAAELAAAGADWLFVDTAPAITEANADLLKLADLVIVPLCASPNDVRALAKTLPILEAAGKPYAFVLMRVNPNAKLTAQTAMTLSEHGVVLQPAIRERVGYPVSMIDGRTVQELEPKGPAAKEINELWNSVKRRIDEKTKKRKDIKSQ